MKLNHSFCLEFEGSVYAAESTPAWMLASASAEVFPAEMVASLGEAVSALPNTHPDLGWLCERAAMVAPAIRQVCAKKISESAPFRVSPERFLSLWA